MHRQPSGRRGNGTSRNRQSDHGTSVEQLDLHGWDPFFSEAAGLGGPYQCGGHLRYVPNCLSDAVPCIYLRVGWVICFEPICEPLVDRGDFG